LFKDSTYKNVFATVLPTTIELGSSFKVNSTQEEGSPAGPVNVMLIVPAPVIP
jgi:hypothetical protein